MSNLETAPAEVACGAPPVSSALPPVHVLHPREVPLGGPRAMRVQRTLPQRQRSLIGAWCFIDHYGPASARMDVAPHPHTGLQTVSWLFSGGVEHRDSAGVHALIQPGELNLMTAGAGICHSEVSVASATVLHGVQLWVALPDSDRDTGRDFAHYVPAPTSLPGGVARVFLGELAGRSSPVHTFTPLLGAQIDLDVERPAGHPRRPRIRTRRPVRLRPRSGRRRDAGRRRPGVPKPRQSHTAPAQSFRRAGARRAVGRHPLRRRARNVVELRRAQPRRHRQLPPTVGGRRQTLRSRPRVSGFGHPAARPATAYHPAAASTANTDKERS